MQPFGVSVGHLKDALVPHYAKQIPGTAVQRGAGPALPEVIFDRHAQIWFDITIDEIRQLVAD